MVKMAKRPFEELVELLKRELGRRLRVVLQLGPDGSERLFARDDLESRSDDELGEPFARAFLESDEPVDLVHRRVDGPDCLVGFVEETVLVVLYRQTNEAVAIAFDRSPEDSLTAFVERCLESMR